MMREMRRDGVEEGLMPGAIRYQRFMVRRENAFWYHQMAWLKILFEGSGAAPADQGVDVLIQELPCGPMGPLRACP